MAFEVRKDLILACSWGDIVHFGGEGMWQVQEAD